ncbi:MAG: response regulator [Desulfobacteraceae bacterium]|nr:MAG: response regulator [Desulfobacteraceae bacterium]
MRNISEGKKENDLCRVLVVEDESSVANSLGVLLKESGYQVRVAGTGKDALETLDRHEVDLFVADLQLPDMNGMEVVRQTRRRNPQTGIIVMTGEPSVPAAVEAMKSGVLDYLPKPFTKEEFLNRVQRALGRRPNTHVEPPKTANRPKESARAHVLVVEDSPGSGSGLETLLTSRGYGVDLVDSGKKALEEIDRKDFDLLITDLRLPDIKGTEVIRIAKKKRPRTAVIVMTGHPNISTAVEAMKSGAADFLEKPFTEEEFLQRVVAALNGGVHPTPAAQIRIGFYVCHGGTDIAGKIRIDDLMAFAGKQEQVTVVREAKYLCQESELRAIEEDVKRLGLNRVIVGACAPKAAERVFHEAFKRSGLQPAHVHTVSLREQVAWVSEDPLEAGRRAKILVAAAIHRAKYHTNLGTRTVAVHPEVLVVGGGIAGMQAALEVAESGYKVHLVEKQPTIGGHMLQFDKTFPTLDCAACIGTPKMVSVGQNPNINLLTCSEVKEISGMVGDYKVKILRHPRYVKEGICTGCGECANVCPVIVASEWDEGLGRRKAVYRPFPQAVPITFSIDKKDRAPCVGACPAGVNVQGYVQLIGQGKYREALQLIMERVPLPGVLGRVCPHPCESQCRRKDVDEPVAIRDLKRFVADRIDPETLPLPEIPVRSEKVAIVGGGPAGLTAACYLRRKGYGIRLYEALPVLGGMLRVGIPDYRLPPEVLDKEIGSIIRLGIEVRTGQALGRDFTLNDLEREGFNAVFLATGAHKGMKVRIPGEDQYEGILDAVDFLREANLGKKEVPGNRVAIIGGGNVAVDAARVAARLGAAEVRMVYRRSREEMPAYGEEIESALEEGIEISYCTAPMRILGEGGRVTGIECLRTKLGEPASDGRRRPIPIEGSRFVIQCDAVITAVGQAPDTEWLKSDQRFRFSGQGAIEVNPYTMQTAIPRVFAAGDGVTGPAAVIEAVAGAHKAVEAIDRFLRGDDLTLYAGQQKTLPPTGNDWAPIPKKPQLQSRSRAEILCAKERISSFKEVDLGLSAEEAGKEALRCLNCGTCSECMECVKVCEAKAIDHTMKPEELEVNVGSIILATGYNLMDPTSVTQYGYGKYPNVLTSLEFERLNNATGPTAGRILMRDDTGKFTSPPESVAIIHCVGSRDSNYHEYCSRVCCMYALKYGHLLKDKLGHQTRVYDFYIDMRCFGKGYEEFYVRCQKEGVLFYRGKPAEVTDRALTAQEQSKLVIVGEDTLMNTGFRIPVDMVILCAAMQAREDSGNLARTFGIRRGQDGFFSEEQAKLAPLNASSAGIFLAGACQGPKDIPDTVAQASGAAAKALELAIRGKIEVPATIAWIDPEACEGCRTCVKLCPDSAVSFDAVKGISMVNQAACSGCGICAAACPQGAAHLWQYREDRILTELDGFEEPLLAAG